MVGVPFKFVHAADLHLDSPFKGLSKVPETVRERLRESTFAAFRRLAGAAIRERVDFIVLSGDLYDAADRSLRAQLRLQRVLAELAAEGIAVFLVHGNHDPESGRQANLDTPALVRAFGSEEVECATAFTRGGEVAAHVYGISYKTAAVADNLALRFRKRDGAPFHIAVLHANVDGAAGHDNYAPCRLDELTTSGFDYWALGHIHDRRVLSEYPHVVYPGNVQGRSIRETGGKGAYVVSVSETGAVDMRFLDAAEVLWHEISVSIEGAEREQDLKNRLLDAVLGVRDSSEGRASVVRVKVEGRGPLHERLLQASVVDEWLEELRDWAGAPNDGEPWIWIESLAIRTGGLASLRVSAEDNGFLGELLRRGLASSEDPEQSRLLAEEALDSLRRSPKVRQWLESKSHEERAEWIGRAMELATELLRDEETG